MLAVARRSYSCRARGAGGAAPFGEVRGGSEGSSGPTSSPRCAASVTLLSDDERGPDRRREDGLRAARRPARRRLGPRRRSRLRRSTRERRRELEQQFPKVRVVPSPAWAVADADVVILAVKPGDVAASLQAAESSLRSETLVLSIAAGVTIATIEALVPGRPVVRAMPNTPALVGLGASAIAAGRHAERPPSRAGLPPARCGRHRRDASASRRSTRSRDSRAPVRRTSSWSPRR